MLMNSSLPLGGRISENKAVGSLALQFLVGLANEQYQQFVMYDRGMKYKFYSVSILSPEQ